MASKPNVKKPPAGSRATLSLVAQAADVALVTASFALRGNPKISAETRLRVKRAAKKLGSVPNPELGRLMQLIRSGRKVAQQSTIALLSFDPILDAEQNHYFSTLVSGVEQRARDLGYGIDLLAMSAGEMTEGRLTTILRSRGIHGIVVLPIRRALDCSPLVDWSRFSVVAATYTAQQLSVNRVVPHHHQIGLLAMKTLHEKGFRRVGLITEEGDNERVNYAFQAVLAMYQQAGHFKRIPAAQSGARSDIAKWYDRYRPDVILTTENRPLPSLVSRLGPSRISLCALCLLNHPAGAAYPGVYQHPEIVGRMAVDLEAGQIQRGECGILDHPTVSRVEGSWVEGPVLKLT